MFPKKIKILKIGQFLPIYPEASTDGFAPNFVQQVADVITSENVFGDRIGTVKSVEGRKSQFLIDKASCRYNRLYCLYRNSFVTSYFLIHPQRYLQVQSTVGVIVIDLECDLLIFVC